MIYTVNAKNIGNVTGIYFYLEVKNHNDTVVLDLLKAESKHKSDDPKICNITSEGKISGTLSVGCATKKDLEGMLKVKSIAELHDLMVLGKNVRKYPYQRFPKG